jgi:hypothetical protein
MYKNDLLPNNNKLRLWNRCAAWLILILYVKTEILHLKIESTQISVILSSVCTGSISIYLKKTYLQEISHLFHWSLPVKLTSQHTDVK